MPREITSVLRQGLPSKLYFLAYSKPRSIYGISKKIYGGTARPQHLYKWKNRLVEKGHLVSIDEKWQSDPSPLFEEIITQFKKEKKRNGLSDFQKDLIRKVINSSMYRNNVELFTDKAIKDKEFDGIEHLLIIFDILMIQWYEFFNKHRNVPHSKTTEESQKYAAKLYSINKSNVRKKVKKEIKRYIDKLDTNHKKELSKKVEVFNIDDDIFLMSLFPLNLMKEMMGVSSVGRIYLKINYDLTSILNDFAQQLNGRSFR